jgi:hypothetical protein
MSNAKLVINSRTYNTNEVSLPNGNSLKITPRKQEVWTIHKLVSLFTTQGTAYITINGVSGIFNSWQREDGSGRSFILYIKTASSPKLVPVYVRTID